MKNPFLAVVVFLGSGFVLTVLAFAMQWWISLTVAEQLQAAGIVPKHEVAEIRADVDENADDIDGIIDRWNNLVDALAAQRVE